jgi:recombination protein RecT
MTNVNEKNVAKTVSFKEETINHVLTKINDLIGSGQLVLQPNYSAANALQSAWFKLIEIPKGKDKTLIELCTKSSIANALFKMVADGLNPGKNQVYFIPYGTKLECQRSYQGSIALAKRHGKLEKIAANVIYEGDDFSFDIDIESGCKKIKKHSSSITNIGGKIIGAYAVCVLEDGTSFAEIMSIGQIQKAWEQGVMKGGSPAHKNFDDQMVKKTVINRACKTLINSSDDTALYTTDESDNVDYIANSVHAQIEEDANKGDIINIDNIDNSVEVEVIKLEEEPNY